MASSLPGWSSLVFLGTGLLSWCLVGLVQRHARRTGLLAMPGPRQSHEVPTPTGGGVGMVAALVPVSLLATGFPTALVPGMVVLCLLGWLDDRYTLGASLRLAVQVAVSLGLLGFVSTDGVGAWMGIAGWIAGLFFLAGMMNAWNFMDGSNGMAGSQGLFSGLALTGLFACAQRPDLVVASLSVAAACAGFLPWNLPRARVFMGDAGSVPLGFAVAALLLLGVLDGVLPVAVALLLPAVFLVDAGMTLVRRFLLGEQWYTAHRQHMYQRLIGKGWSHNQVLTLYQAINLFVVLPGVVLGAKYSGAAWLITGILILAMIVTWLSMSLKLGEST